MTFSHTGRTGDRIYAAPSSIVGSIGVINQGLGFHELLQKVGVERRTFTAGENKAKLDPLAPLQEKDVEFLKGLLNEIHQHFIEHVKSSRGERLAASDEILFNGDFWTAEPAVKLGLIDGVDRVESFIAREWGEEGREVEVVRVKGQGDGLGGLLAGVATQLWSAQQSPSLPLPLAADPGLADLVSALR